MIAQPENGPPFGITKFSDYAVVHEWRSHAGCGFNLSTMCFL